MPGPRPYVGLTKLPEKLPHDAVVARKDCGCYLVMDSISPACSEFVCEHGYWVSVSGD